MPAKAPIVIFHKDHPLDPLGANAGAETATVMLATALARRGNHVFVAANLSNVNGATSISARGVTFIDFSENFDTTRVFETLERGPNALPNFNLIVACRGQALLESRYKSQVLSRLFITHEPSATAFGVQAAVIGNVADRVICVSEAQKAGMVDAGCRADNIVVVQNGVDLETFLPGDADTRNYQRLVFVGALVIDKGVHLLLEAFIQLKRFFPQLTLDIYGSAALWGRGDYFNVSDVEKAVSGLTFHGAVQQAVIAKAFSEAGLLVSPSIYFESFGLAVAEAQSTGLPALTAKNGGMGEIVLDGVTGKLLEEISVDSLVREIRQLIANPEVLRKMSLASLELMRPKYSWDKTALEIECVIRECEEDNRAASSASKCISAGQRAPQVELLEPKIGILSTFNQRCGLATYASHLLSHFGDVSYAVLAEETSDNRLTKPDEPFVKRCWKRNASDFVELEQVIKAEKINILYLNCHYRFFKQPEFAKFLLKLKSYGVKTISHIHNPFTIDDGLAALVAVSSKVIVHTAENRLEVIANGAEPANVVVIEHGVKAVASDVSKEARHKVRIRRNVPLSENTVVCFGFIQAHKGIDEVIKAIADLKRRLPNIHLYIIGEPHKEDPNGHAYSSYLRELVSSNGLSGQVTFLGEFVDESVVTDYLSIADAVVMNYRSNYFEASGAIALALGCGAAIVTSTAPAFARMQDAVFHVTAGYPLTTAIEAVVSNEVLNNELRQNAVKWARQYCWENVAGAVLQLCREVAADNGKWVDESKRDNQHRKDQSFTQRGRAMKILMQNRSNALTHPGGDTVLMERVRQELIKRGLVVDVDLDGRKDPKEYDLVHLYNFATPQVTESYAKKASENGVPFIVSALYEDLPRFYNQMLAHYEVLRGYIQVGQKRDKWESLFELAQRSKPSGSYNNAWVAENAEALIVSGEHEKAVIERDYPRHADIAVCKWGCDLEGEGDAGNMFFRETGIKDFVLCVGRLETRKNQLSILRALEDSDLTLVFATGGFTYQPDYEEACRRFRRLGRTVFLERVTPQMLASAYSGARVHALASWYELPGIASMEAARLGTNIVVTDFGTARDYFGESAYYCKPDDIDGIANAIVAAYYAPMRRGLRESVANCTWSNTAEAIQALYDRVLSCARAGSRSSYQLSSWSNSDPVHTIQRSLEEVQRTAETAQSAVSKIATAIVERPNLSQAASLCEQADNLLRGKDVIGARERYDRAIAIDSQCGRAYRGKGIAALEENNLELARRAFEIAIDLDANDARAYAGLGLCELYDGKPREAFLKCKAASERAPDDVNILLQVVNIAYPLNELVELERIVARCLEHNPDNLEIRYCLAGCYFKQGKYAAASKTVDCILLRDPGHENALELKTLIETNGIAKGTAEDNIVLRHSDEIECLLREVEELKGSRELQRAIAGAERIVISGEASSSQRALARVLKAECLAHAGQLDLAEREFALVMDDKIYASRALTGRGVISAEKGLWEDAKRNFQTAVEKHSRNDASLAGLGLCFVREGNLEQGWNYFREALNVNPENMRAILGVVEVGYKLNRVGEIEAALAAYLDIHPANVSILYASAGALYFQGQREKALAQLSKILIFEPQHALARELIDRIAAGSVDGARLGI